MAANLAKAHYCAILLLIVSPVVRSQLSTVTPIRRLSNLLYKEVDNFNKGTVSFVVCPPSIAFLAAFVSLGAEDETLDELHNTIYTRDADDTKNKYGYLMSRLTSWNSVTLNIASKMYYKDDLTVEPAIETDAATFFNAEFEAINLNDINLSAADANAWLASKTENTIDDLQFYFPYHPNLRAVLLNAVYFNGTWLKKFNPGSNSINRPFYLLNGQVQKLTMMNQNTYFLYGTLPSLDARAIEMFYVDNELSMVIILPNKKTGLKDIEAKLQSSTNWKSLLAGLKSTAIRLMVPKFITRTTVVLPKILPELGVNLLFDKDNAQLNPMFIDDVDPLHVITAEQKLIITFNEEGTTTTALTTNTGFGRSSTASPVRPLITFNVDRPFLYLIRDRLGHIIFMGCFKGYAPK